MLHEVGRRLRATVRTFDRVGYLGGDRFVALLRRVPPTDPEVVADHLAAAIGQPIHLADGTELPRIRSSFGLVAAEGSSAEVLLRRAELAHRQAKEAQARAQVVA